mmetsp:Transcript_2053/g.2570  ORF Transcript_2053/g.2570 Transcript_2053/m.2570 type:complete len:157 (-) Transcript_2053:60-530(-)
MAPKKRARKREAASDDPKHSKLSRKMEKKAVALDEPRRRGNASTKKKMNSKPDERTAKQQSRVGNEVMAPFERIRNKLLASKSKAHKLFLSHGCKRGWRRKIHVCEKERKKKRNGDLAVVVEPKENVISCKPNLLKRKSEKKKCFHQLRPHKSRHN